METRYFKVYTENEYSDALNKLNTEGCTWPDGKSLLSKGYSYAFQYPIALVVKDGKVWKDEIRHCPDPSDRRLEETHLHIGDKVKLSSKYYEHEKFGDEVFKIIDLKMIGLTPCAFLDHGELGAYACDGLIRV